MTCRVFILDFEQPGLLKGADPETIARTSRLWEKDMENFGPWTRTRTPAFDDETPAWTFHPDTVVEKKDPAILVCGRCTSTMDAAWHFIERGRLDEWDSVMAVEQNAGRGQKHRQWISPAGNLHASWRWPLPAGDGETGPEWSGLLSLMAGFILARAFGELGVSAKIKWPNDLLLYDHKAGLDRKFGGILVERRGNHVVIGCGINIGHCPGDRQLREESAVPAARLADYRADLSPLFLWATLVDEGKSLFESLIVSATPGEFVRMIETKMAWIGRTVLIRKTDSEVFEAKILGLAEDGALRVKKGTATEVIYAGSILPV